MEDEVILTIDKIQTVFYDLGNYPKTSRYCEYFINTR